MHERTDLVESCTSNYSTRIVSLMQEGNGLSSLFLSGLVLRTKTRSGLSLGSISKLPVRVKGEKLTTLHGGTSGYSDRF